MRILVFSDIHGNGYAMDAFMKMLPSLSYDRIVFLGDIFGYYYDQETCIRFMRDIPNLIWLKGNHDEYAAEAYFGSKKTEKLIASYGHSYDLLQERFTDAEMEFISSLPASYVFCVDGRKIGLFHGRPADALEGRFYQDTEAESNEFDPYDIVFLGHTHCKTDRTVGNTRVMCPGSLGQPRDGKGYGFIIFDFKNDTCEYVNINVDSGLLRRDIDKNDPELLKLYDVLAREESEDHRKPKKNKTD